jgi:hypothetical protein
MTQLLQTNMMQQQIALFVLQANTHQVLELEVAPDVSKASSSVTLVLSLNTMKKQIA